MPKWIASSVSYIDELWCLTLTFTLTLTLTLTLTPSLTPLQVLSGAVVAQGELDATVTAVGAGTFFGRTISLLGAPQERGHLIKVLRSRFADPLSQQRRRPCGGPTDGPTVRPPPPWREQFCKFDAVCGC